MTAPKYSKPRADGLFAYVRKSSSWGRTSERLVYAQNLKEAKAKYGFTRELYTVIDIRRASPSEASELGDYR